MFEALLFSGTNDKILVPGYTGSVKMTAVSNRLTGAIFSMDGIAYLYGGADATYNYQNDLYTFTRAAGMTLVNNFGLDWPALRWPKAYPIGRKVYIFGLNNSLQFTVRIMDYDTRTSRSVASTIVPGMTPQVHLGMDYHPGLNAFFMKYAGSNVVARWNLGNETWSTVTTPSSPAAFTSNEFLVCGEENLFFFAGVNQNVSVHLVPFAGGVAPVLHGQLDDPKMCSQYQGYVAHKGVAYYPAWNTDRFVFHMFQPEKLKPMLSPLPLLIPFKNMGSVGKALTGIVFSGGIGVPVGSANWQQETRQNTMYEISVDFDAN